MCVGCVVGVVECAGCGGYDVGEVVYFGWDIGGWVKVLEVVFGWGILLLLCDLFVEVIG